MIVRESISFERYKDPKKALGLLPNPKEWWDEMAEGDIFEMIKDIPGLKRYTGYKIKVTDVETNYHNTKEKDITYIIYDNHFNIIDEDKEWVMGYNFFKEYFVKIN